VAFGEGITMQLRRGTHQLSERKDHQESRYAYTNRRAEMYGELREVLDPNGGLGVDRKVIGGPNGFAIPRECVELRRQLAPIPLVYDEEGRLKLPPKNRVSENSKQKSLVEILGCGPDDADSCVLAVCGMAHKPLRPVAGAI